MTAQRKGTAQNLFTSLLNTHRGEIDFRNIAEQVMDAMFIVVPRTGLFLYVNQKALALTGFTRPELESLSLSELIPAREGAPALELLRTLGPGAIDNIQNVPLRDREGRLVVVDLRVSITLTENDDTVAILFARASEQRAAHEQQIVRRTESLSALNGMLLMLASPALPELTEAIEMAHRVLQAECTAYYTPMPDRRGLVLAQACHLPADFPTQLSSIDSAVSGAPLDWRTGLRPTSALTRAARANDLGALHAYPTDHGADGIGLLAVCYRLPHVAANESSRLVSAMVRLINALLLRHTMQNAMAHANTELASARQLAQIVSSESVEGLLRVNISGRVTEINRAAESLLGFSAAGTLGAPLEDVLISARPLASPIVATLRQGLPWSGTETELIRRDGQSLAAFVHARPITAPDSQPEGGIVFVSDRTDHRQFQAQSDHLERRAWLGDLSAIFAHDVRNPLNGISTGLDYLATKFSADHSLSADVSKMQAEVTRIEQLLRNVLLVAKSSAIRYSPTSLPALLERSLARWKPRLSIRQITVDYHADPDTPPAMADANQMEQVFTNLIVNAADAMSAGNGLLAIRVGPAAHTSAPRGEFVEISFTDTGPGIPPDMRERIFDPFITTKSHGTGLGLAITKQIINAHKGTIRMDSYAGTGTVFRLFIPVARQADDQPLAAGN